MDANGIVYAGGEGTATITAKAGGKSAKVKIKVVDPNKPDSISFAQGKALTVNVGQPVQLNANLEPATAQAALTWTSSKPGVAVVDGNGLVTAVGKGSAKITVQAANYKKVKATFTVKVSAAASTAGNDVTAYMLQNAKTVAKQLKLKPSEQGDGCYLGNGIWIDPEDNDESKYYGLVRWINLDGNAYNVNGAAVGMTLAQADATLKQAGWTAKTYNDEDEDAYARYYKGNLNVELSYRRSTGIVQEIDLSLND